MALFKPLQAMEEIYQASVSPLSWRKEHIPTLLRLWWACWLAAGISGYIAILISRGSSSIPDLIAAICD